MKVLLAGVSSLCLLLALSGCTQGSSGQPALPPTPSFTSSAPAPSASTTPSSSATPTPSVSSATPTPVPTVTAYAPVGIAILTYHSGQRSPSADFTVTDQGYRVVYRCIGELPKGAVGEIDSGYTISGVKAISAHRQMKCDSEEHSEEFHPKVNPAYDERTVILTGDRQGVSGVQLRVELINADLD